MNFLIELINRIRTESPKFFVILRWSFGVLGLLALISKWLLTKEILNPQYGSAISELCGYILTAAGTIWGVSFLPVNTANKPEKIMDAESDVVGDGTRPGHGKGNP